MKRFQTSTYIFFKPALFVLLLAMTALFTSCETMEVNNVVFKEIEKAIQKNEAKQQQEKAEELAKQAGTQPAQAEAEEAATQPADDEPNQALRLGMQHWASNAGFLLAKREQMFYKRGIELRINSYLTEEQIERDFTDQQIDLAILPLHRCLQLADDGVGFKIVALLQRSLLADVIIAKAPINSLRDLKGQKIAYAIDTAGQALVEAGLEKASLHKGQLKIKLVREHKLYDVFQNDDIRAVALKLPLLPQPNEQFIRRKAILKDESKIIATAQDTGLNLNYVLVVREATLKDNILQLRKLLRIRQASIDHLLNNTNKAAAELASLWRIDKATAQAAVQSVQYYSIRDNQLRYPRIFPQQLQALINQAKRDGRIEKSITSNNLLSSLLIDDND